MNDDVPDTMPATWHEIGRKTRELGFDMASDARTGALLRTLAASKPGGRLLELGTGTGLATACLLAGMDATAHLTSVDNDPKVQDVARTLLGYDKRVTFILADGLAFLTSQPRAGFDLLFADAWPGKYDGLDDALDLVRSGGFYIGDDMLPQPNWPDNHQQRVDGLVAELHRRPEWTVVNLSWGSGFVIAVRSN